MGSKTSDIGQSLEVLSLQTHKQPECTEALEVDWLALDSSLDFCALLFASGSKECKALGVEWLALDSSLGFCVLRFALGNTGCTGSMPV